MAIRQHTGQRAIVKKARQRLHFVRILGRCDLDQRLLVNFYHWSMESILTYSLNLWYPGSTALDRKAVQTFVNTAQTIISCSPPPIVTISRSCCQTILNDPIHAAHHLFDLMSSGCCHRSIRSHTTRLSNGFFAWAKQMLNNKIPLSREADKAVGG